MWILLVIVIIYLAYKLELVIHTFVMPPFPFLFQSHGGQFDEVHTCALWNVTNCGTVGVNLLRDDVDDHFNHGYKMVVTPIT